MSITLYIHTSVLLYELLYEVVVLMVKILFFRNRKQVKCLLS